MQPKDIGSTSRIIAWTKGTLIHLTNPKVVIFWGSISAIGAQTGASAESLLWVIMVCIAIIFVLLSFYALLFSSEAIYIGSVGQVEMAKFVVFLA